MICRTLAALRDFLVVVQYVGMLYFLTLLILTAINDFQVHPPPLPPHDQLGYARFLSGFFTWIDASPMTCVTVFNLVGLFSLWSYELSAFWVDDLLRHARRYFVSDRVVAALQKTLALPQDTDDEAVRQVGKRVDESTKGNLFAVTVLIKGFSCMMTVIQVLAGWAVLVLFAVLWGAGLYVEGRAKGFVPTISDRRGFVSWLAVSCVFWSLGCSDTPTSLSNRFFVHVQSLMSLSNLMNEWLPVDRLESSLVAVWRLGPGRRERALMWADVKLPVLERRQGGNVVAPAGEGTGENLPLLDVEGGGEQGTQAEEGPPPPAVSLLTNMTVSVAVCLRVIAIGFIWCFPVLVAFVASAWPPPPIRATQEQMDAGAPTYTFPPSWAVWREETNKTAGRNGMAGEAEVITSLAIFFCGFSGLEVAAVLFQACLLAMWIQWVSLLRQARERCVSDVKVSVVARLNADAAAAGGGGQAGGEVNIDRDVLMATAIVNFRDASESFVERCRMRVMEAGSWWPRAALICGMFAIKSIFDHSILLLPLFKALAHSGTQQDPSIVKRRSIAHGLLLASLAQALLSAVVCPLVLWGISHFDDEYLKRATGEEMPHDLMTALDVLAELPRGAREALLFFSFGGRRRFLDQILQQRLAALRRARRADYASTEAPSSEPEASEGEQGQREGEDQEWDEDIESLDMQEQGDVRSRHTHTHSRHQRSPLRSPAAPPSSTPQHVPVRSLLAAPPLPPPVHANIPSASGSASAHANANTAAAAGPNSAASPPLNPVPAEGFPVPQE